MNYNNENVQAKYALEIVFWLGLVIASFFTWPILIIVIIAAMFLSTKISSHNKLLKEHIKLLKEMNAEPQVQNKGLNEEV